MVERDQLKWVQANRAEKSRACAAGDLVKRVAEQVLQGAYGAAEDAAGRLSEIVDDEFREHCRVVECRGGVLRINVDEPAWGYVMRQRWSSRIRQVLGYRVKNVLFEYGDTGVRIPNR